MLPKRLREGLFEKASVKTMRYVTAVPVRDSIGLVRHTYDQIADDFFVNGSLSSHSRVPELFAGSWVGGREVVLVTDRIDRTTKEAMGATLSYINDCPYCADMLVSLVHGSGKHTAATNIFNKSEEEITDPRLRERLAWVRQVATEGAQTTENVPFTKEELPEAIATLLVLNYVNRFSHVAMDGSPVGKPLKNAALKLFGYELRATTERAIRPGRSLDLLPPAPIPQDLSWARPNPRIADALSRWSAAVDREASVAISPQVRKLILDSLSTWQGELMPLSRSWVESELGGLDGDDYHIAKLILVVAKSSYQFDESLVEPILQEPDSEERLICFLSFAAISAARRLANNAAHHLGVLPHGLKGEATSEANDVVVQK